MNDAAHEDRGLTIREAFEKHYVPHLAETDAADKTLEAYQHCINCWEKFTQNPPVGEIDDERAKAFQDACRQAGHRPQTINKTWGHLRAILRRLGPQETRNPLGQGILNRVPHLKSLPARRRIPRFVKLEDLNRLYRACDSADWPRTIIPPADWWRTLIVLVYNCGPRYADLINLAPANFDLEEAILDFDAGKTGKQHLIPLNRVTLAHVQRIWSPREKLFPTGSWQKKIRTEWRELQDKAGIEKHFTFHDLRRTCATMFQKLRPDLPGLILGHTLNNVTLTSYVNPIEPLRDPVEQLEQPSEFLGILKDPARQKSVVMEYLLSRQRSKWEFHARSAIYQGTEIKLYPRRLAVLRALVIAGRPLSFGDLRGVVWWNRPKVSNTVIKTTVCELKGDLRKALDFPDGWNPIPWQDGGWVLDFPINWRLA